MARQVGRDDGKIDIDALATELESMMRHNMFMSCKCCIFRVPNILLRHNPKAYKPNAFSIGPFHYGKSHLKATQKIKLKYLHDLISRLPSDTNPETKLRNLTAAVSEVREAARECYEGSIGMSMDKFVKVLVLDGCFLIELFRKTKYPHLREEDDPIFSMSCMREFLFHDLILLENQIPWLVLDVLFNMPKTIEHDLPRVATTFFSTMFSRIKKLDDQAILQSLLNAKNENKHILDLLRNAMVLSSSTIKDRRVSNWMKDWQPMPSVTSLQEAGIQFKKATTSSILDIKFENGVLEIPPLLIQESTESLFRNLICLEQCLPHCYGIITSYAMLLDNLINTAKDMEILCKSGVIDNWLNTDEAAEFFNQLYNDTLVQDFYYLKLMTDVNKYCRLRLPKWRRVLMHDYFKHPWSAISVIVAATLLILTFLQTLFTIIK